MKKNISSYLTAIVAVVAIIGFSAFKTVERIQNPNAETAILYFHGDPTNEDQVKDTEFWNDAPNNENCNNINELACSMTVSEDDIVLIGTSRYLNPSIIINTFDSGAGFYPTSLTGSVAQPIQIKNRN